MSTGPDPLPLNSDRTAQIADLALEIALARGLAQVLARARDLIHALPRDIDAARELALILDRARDLAHLLDPDLDPDLALHLDAARDAACTLAYDRGFNLIRARALAHALDGTQVALNALNAAPQQQSTSADSEADPSVSSSGPEANRAAVRLARLTVRCLPVRHRARYREEYAAELGDLAGISRQAQWRYVSNIVARAWVLRRDLRRADHVPVAGRWLE